MGSNAAHRVTCPTVPSPRPPRHGAGAQREEHPTDRRGTGAIREPPRTARHASPERRGTLYRRCFCFSRVSCRGARFPSPSRGPTPAITPDDAPAPPFSPSSHDLLPLLLAHLTEDALEHVDRLCRGESQARGAAVHRGQARRARDGVLGRASFKSHPALRSQLAPDRTTCDSLAPSPPPGFTSMENHPEIGDEESGEEKSIRS